MKKLIKKFCLISLLASLSLIGCVTDRQVFVELPIPARPIYPVITDAQAIQFKNVLPEVFDILGKRENMCQARISRLENLIRVYNESIKK